MHIWYNAPLSSAASSNERSRLTNARRSCVVESAVRASVTHTTTSHFRAHSIVTPSNDAHESSVSQTPGKSTAQKLTPSVLTGRSSTAARSVCTDPGGPMTVTEVVVRQTPDCSTRFPTSALIMVDFPELGNPANPTMRPIFFGAHWRRKKN